MTGYPQIFTIAALLAAIGVLCVLWGHHAPCLSDEMWDSVERMCVMRCPPTGCV